MKRAATTFLLSILVITVWSSTVDHASLKAVLIVGPQQDFTRGAEKSMDKIADLFQERGISVYKFYDEKAEWSAIKDAAQGANFLVYSGHGMRCGENGAAGGLCLKWPVSAKTMEEELKLADGALVLFQSVCLGAGSSAGDNKDIGLEEAATRVKDYSSGFFRMGAGCYYANNLDDGCYDFLVDFFGGKPLKECFETSAKVWAKVETQRKLAPGDDRYMGIASLDWGGTSTLTTYTNGVKKVKKVRNKKSYSIAYVGPQSFSYHDVVRVN